MRRGHKLRRTETGNGTETLQVEQVLSVELGHELEIRKCMASGMTKRKKWVIKVSSSRSMIFSNNYRDVNLPIKLVLDRKRSCSARRGSKWSWQSDIITSENCRLFALRHIVHVCLPTARTTFPCKLQMMTENIWNNSTTIVFLRCHKWFLNF